MSTTVPEITLDELSTHHTLSSLWIAVHGNVFDVTPFMSDHPGGTEVLLASAGTDGTEAFEYAGHSDLNVKTMQHFKIGRLQGARSTTTIPLSSLPAATKPKPQSTTLALKIFLANVIIGLVAFAHSLWARQGVDVREYEVEETGDGGWNSGFAFWVGVAVASSLGLLGGAWFWSLFRATLEYETGFPATIPRRRKK